MQPHDKQKLINDIPRLQWACRRGMLELDVLLGNFLKDVYPHLAIEEKESFIELLNCADPEIFAWLLGNAQPAEPGLIKITEMIRLHVRK